MTGNEKRIELHCHSKAGGNSSMYPGEILKYLSECGMSAFAITDESGIYAYPELEMVWETGYYSARPIYGMEARIDGIVEGKCDSISVLVKNEIGKKALYRLFSDEKSEEVHPVFTLDKFIENREGLLLGSGTEGSRVYKLARSGAGDDVLKDELCLYDYIEVLPHKEYEAANKRIIALSDELQIPVVAVSDARYRDEIGKKVLTIMNYWNNGGILSDCHFWSTEEMLAAFDYLPESKAYEIVVENTHLIAERCETVSICPKEKYYPKVKDAGKRLRERCYAAISGKYTENLDEVKSRLEWELAALEKTETESYLLQIAELLEKAGLRAGDLSLRGCAVGSLVVYLLGIGNVDPFQYGLMPEMIFGADGQREIDIDINVPESRQLEIISKVAELEGIGNYVWAGTACSISYRPAQAMIEKYMADTGVFFEDSVINEIQWKIEGNLARRGIHPGGVVIFPEGCDYMELMPVLRVAEGFETTYFDYHSMARPFIKFDLLNHSVPDMLLRMSKMTGVDLDAVPVDSEEVLDLFQPDEEGKVAGCADLPEFKSEIVRNIIALLKPESISDLAKISAIVHGTGAWQNNAEILVKEKGLGINDIIATRDDVFDYNLALGIDRMTAFQIAEAVRKGIVSRGKNVKWQNWKKILLEASAPDWYIWSCEQIKYLFPRAHALSYVLMNMKLGWFKVHYPDAFVQVMKEYED